MQDLENIADPSQLILLLILGMRKHIQRKHPEQNIDSRNGYQDKITKLMERSYQNREYSSANFIDEEKPNSFGANNYSNQIKNEGVGGKVKGLCQVRLLSF